MKTVAIIGQKGGTGKTNLAKILLVAFANDGKSALGIDLDPQASLCRWDGRRTLDGTLRAKFEQWCPGMKSSGNIRMAAKLPQTLRCSRKAPTFFLVKGRVPRGGRKKLKARGFSGRVLWQGLVRPAY